MGALISVATQLFPPRPQFSADNVPDLTGKVVIVTGGNRGIGLETVKVLLTKNATVYLAARDESKAVAAISQLKSLTQKSAIFLHLDLADLTSVQAAAEEFMRKECELHVLYNNAGILAPPICQLTKDEYDMQFGTNVLGHFYFTKLLLPVLSLTAKCSPPGTVRIINSSSIAAFLSKLDFSTFEDGPARLNMDPVMLYCQSKYGNIVFSAEFAQRYHDKGIVSVSLHPGCFKTELFRNLGTWQYFFASIVSSYDASYGALTQLWAGTSDAGKYLNGKYLIPWCRVGTPPSGSHDEIMGRALWDWCEEQVRDLPS